MPRNSASRPYFLPSSVHQTVFSSGPNQTSIIQGTQNMEIGQMNVDLTVTNVDNSPIDHLHKYCALGALLESSERYDPPRCAESTRQEIRERLSLWASNIEMPAGLFWLHGAAGAGKSAIAQTFAESLQLDQRLAASFFFSRTTESRNNGTSLIPTIVLQLIDTWPGLKPHVEHRIRCRERFLFSQCREIQARELLFTPLRSLFDSIGDDEDPLASRPQVIVIDGLDECKDPDIQCDLLRLIAKAIASVPFPLRFLITSRPELHITQTFDHDPALQAVNAHIHRFDLSKPSTGASSDLYTFIESKFEEIRSTHLLRSRLPPNWPDSNAVRTLVQRSSGHFIYAATAMRYIQSPQHRPDERLDVVLGLVPARGGETPYAELDALYNFVFTGVGDQIETVHCALGILHLLCEQREGLFKLSLWPSQRCAIEKLLDMEPEDFDLLFVPLRSLIRVTVKKDIKVFHQSLFDYLFDVNRSGQFHLDLAPCHCAAAKFVFVSYIQDKLCSFQDFERFAHHCQLSHLDDTLMGLLGSFEAVYEQLLADVLFFDSPSNNEFYGFLRSTFGILRSLRWKNTLTSQQIHRGHTEKIMKHCQTIIKSHPSQTGITPKLVALLQHVLSLSPILTFDGNINVHSEEGNVESTFRKWQPSSSNFPFNADGKINEMSDDCVKREHKMFSSIVKAWATNDDQLDYHSSLVIGEHFIHSYHYGIQHLHCARPGYIRFEFLLFFTYARHGNLSTCTVVRQSDLFPRGVHRDFADSSVVLHLAREHLEHAESEFS